MNDENRSKRKGEGEKEKQKLDCTTRKSANILDDPCSDHRQLVRSKRRLRKKQKEHTSQQGRDVEIESDGAQYY